ncbi:MAG: cytosine deaminase [Betaproteobacteria bacterium]|nr:cytosine deaminase [Betaproteobacteria bacterium]
MAARLIRGGIVVSMDPAIGDLRRGDVLVEGDRIQAVAERIDAPGAEVIDASGCIVLPGLVNAHQHTWQTALRGVAGNWTILEYFHHVHAGLATKFRPEDIHIATLVGALNQMNCGATTLVDWCHNNPTPEHTDRAVDALVESGIRAAFFHGSPKPDPKPGQKPFWEVPHPRSEVKRLLKRLPANNGLVTLGLAILGPHYSTYEVAQQDFRLAREFGLIASMHCAGGEARTPDGWDRLAAEGLLGDNTNIVHGQTLSDEQLAFMVERGVTFSLTPETEMTQGHGFAITGRLRKLGVQPSLGVDLESAISGDLFGVARAALASQRAMDNADSRATTGKLPETSTIHCREALGWITLEGARMLKMDDRIGSLTPGKQADVILIRADDLNMWPVHDPVTSVVMQANTGNVDTVMVAGEFRKLHGKLLYPQLGRRKEELLASGQRILGELGLLQGH